MMNPAIRPAPEVYLGINLVLSTMLDQWYSEYLYGIILFLSVNVIPILIRTIYTRKYIKQIDNIFNDKTDNENRMRKYLEKKRQIEETFDSIDKEKIDSRISYYIYKINRSMLQDTSILHNVDLGSLFTSIQKLIATYNNMYPLMTSRSFNQGREGKGGYIAIFRLRRRIKRNLSRILNVCYYYATYNKDRQERNFIQKILTEVRESEDKFLHRKLQKEIKIEMVLGMATIVVTFLAPIISSSSLPLINNSLPVITNYITGKLMPLLSTQMVNPINSQVIFFVILSIMYYLWERHISGVFKWYDRMIRTSKVEIDEMNVFDYLKHLESLAESQLSSVSTLDPVCMMIVDEKKPQYISEFERKKVYFCSASCKTEFDKDPYEYLNRKDFQHYHDDQQYAAVAE